jgi:hypothetical protein
MQAAQQAQAQAAQQAQAQAPRQGAPAAQPVPEQGSSAEAATSNAEGK